MNKQALLDRFIRYIKVDSESGSEKEFCLLIENELRSLGLVVERDDVGDKCGSDGFNIYARLDGQGEPLLFSAHLDTVSPGKGIVPVIQDGVIRSSGDTILGSDDKSGVAPVMQALSEIVEGNLPHRTIEVLFSICEEAGLLGSRYADYSKIMSKSAVVLDSSKKGYIINRAPANVKLHVSVKGKSAHAGVSPELGVHALKAAALAVTNIRCGHADEETVMNVSNFLAPGKTNVVPDAARFDMEIRSFTEERLEKHIADVEEALKAACDEYKATYEIEKERSSGVVYVPEDSAIMKELADVYGSLNIPIKTDRTYGGSDATWLFANGIYAMVLGTGMSAVHGLGEYIAIDDLNTTGDVVMALMRGRD